MKRNFIPMALLCATFAFLPRTSRSEFFCQDFISFTLSPSSCSVQLNWSFNQCATGTFFIEYGTGGPLYTIAVVNSNGNVGTVENYQYTDNMHAPATVITLYTTG